MIYIAAPWAKKAEAKELRDQLKNLFDLEVSSAWLDQEDEDYEKANNLERAMIDVAEVQACDIFLFLNMQLSEGKATELGIALTLGKPIFCIGGKQRNVFLHLPQINHVEDVEGFVSALSLL